MAANLVLRSLVNNATKSEAQTTVLKPLSWIIGLLLSATLGAFYINAATWLAIVLAIFSGLAMSIYLFAYLYLMFKDRDSLRSEKYSLKKYQIKGSKDKSGSNSDKENNQK